MDRSEDQLESETSSCYIDGINCYMKEQAVADPADYSHKLNRAGRRYQVVSCLGIPQMCLVSAGAACGTKNDIQMALEILPQILGPGEKVAADSGYVGHPNVLMTPTDIRKVVPKHLMSGSEVATSLSKSNRMLKVIGSRHEIINKRLKDFSILNSRYREKDRLFHDSIFLAVASVTQYNLREKPIHGLEHFQKEIFLK